MTRHEAVEEGEKTHTELVLAARQGAARGSLCLWGPAACLLGVLGWSRWATWGGGCRAQGEGEHTDEPAGRQSRRHAGEPEEETVLPDPCLVPMLGIFLPPWLIP